MGGKELVKMLVETGNGRNSRVIPWWKEYLEEIGRASCREIVSASV